MGHTSAPSTWEWRQEVQVKANVGSIKLVLQKHKTNKEVMRDLCLLGASAASDLLFYPWQEFSLSGNKAVVETKLVPDRKCHLLVTEKIYLTEAT